jgi:cytochrome P450
MRLSSVIGGTVREVQQDVTINGKFFPKGTLIVLGFYSAHHHPENWENPEEFLPVNLLTLQCLITEILTPR